jgi:hypothetical protein
MDRRDKYIALAQKEGVGQAANADVYERRDGDYSRYQNAFNTYRVPQTNTYLEKWNASKGQ